MKLQHLGYLSLAAMLASPLSYWCLRGTGAASVAVEVASQVAFMAAANNDGANNDGAVVMQPVHETRTKEIAYQVMRPVREDRSKTIAYTVMKVVREKRTKADPVTGGEIEYTVARYVPEQREKIVNYVVTKMVPEQRRKTIEYQTVRFESARIPR